MVLIDEILTNDNPVDSDYSLPPQHRCKSHTLNFIDTKDSEKALSDVIHKR